MQKTETKFAKAFQTTPFVLAISTLPEGRIIEVNESFQRIMEYSREEAIGRTPMELNIWDPPMALEMLFELLRRQDKGNSFEATFRSKSGRLFAGQASAEIIELKSEQYLLTVFNEITEAKRMVEEVEILNTNLASHAVELEEAYNDLLASSFMATHDLRNLLTAVTCYCALLPEERLDEKSIGYIRRISSAAQKMDQRIGAISHGKGPIPHPFGWPKAG